MTTIVLRHIADQSGTRHLGARMNASGDLLIEGQDLGEGVEQFFGTGTREYEWVWTVRAANIAKLAAALGAKDDVLAALRARFSGALAAGLHGFLKESEVPFESWSRVGD
jgi:hypothetical protein